MKTKLKVIDKPWAYAEEVPEYYDVDALTHEDAQNDDQVRVFTIEELAEYVPRDERCWNPIL